MLKERFTCDETHIMQKTPEHTETQILQRNECIITGENDT